MSADTVLDAAGGAVMGLGITILLYAVFPPDPVEPGTACPPWWRRAGQMLRRWGTGPRRDDVDDLGTGWGAWRWPTALAAGLLAWVATAWPVAGLAVAAGVIGLPLLLTAAGASARDIERAEAIEEWTRRLADVLVVGTGLEQAITATVRTCPAAVARPVADLAARLRARWATETALRVFADDLDDAIGDLVVAALILSSRRRGPGLAKVLVGVADSLADEVAMRRKVEAERAKPRTTARAVTAITVGVLVVAGTNTTYLRPYGTPLGQLALAVLLAAFAGALIWMHALGRGHRAPRVLAPVPPATTAASPLEGLGPAEVTS